MVELLNENLKQPHESVQAAAARALRHVLHAYFGGAAAPTERLRKLTVHAYLTLLRTSENVACTRGAALALGTCRGCIASSRHSYFLPHLLVCSPACAAICLQLRCR